MNKDKLISNIVTELLLVFEKNIPNIKAQDYEKLADELLLTGAITLKKLGNDEMMKEYESKHAIGFKTVETLKMQANYNERLIFLTKLFEDIFRDF